MPPPVSASQTACTVNLGFEASLRLAAAKLGKLDQNRASNFRRFLLPELRPGSVLANWRFYDPAWFPKLGVRFASRLHN